MRAPGGACPAGLLQRKCVNRLTTSKRAIGDTDFDQAGDRSSGGWGARSAAISAHIRWAEHAAMGEIETKPESNQVVASLDSRLKPVGMARTNTVNLALLVTLVLSVIAATCLGAVRLPVSKCSAPSCIRRGPVRWARSSLDCGFRA